MANTYNLIEAKTLGTAIASVEFSSIPQTYTDLLFKLSTRAASAGDWTNFLIGFNGGTSNISWRGLYAYGTTVGSNSGSGGLYRIVGNSASDGNTSNVFSNTELYIPDYTSTSKGKSVAYKGAVENDGTGNILDLGTVFWSPGTQAAITSVVFTNSASPTANFMVGSTFYLYGIKNS